MQLLLKFLRQFRDKQASEQKPLFWLGAGCSVHDGVPLNADLLRQAVPPDPNDWGSPQFRFDRFCDSLGAGVARAKYLDPYLRRSLTPTSPYRGLVRLLRRGYADVVFTMNIDDLLEQALAAARLHEHRDYRVVKVPELQPRAAAIQVGDPGGPRIRIVKLHGDHTLGLNYMTSAEITRYDATIRELVAKYSSRPAVVCGYSFFHLNVLDAFSQERSPLFYVNRSFPDAPMVLSLMAARNGGAALFIDDQHGRPPIGTFSKFIDRLTSELP